MALIEIEQKRIEKTVSVFVERRRPPPHIRKDLDFRFRIYGQSVELLEVRPPWRDRTRTVEHGIAKATLVRSKSVWRVFWQRADLKWHRYDPVPEVETIEEFLDVVDKDVYGAFFG